MTNEQRRVQEILMQYTMPKDQLGFVTIEDIVAKICAVFGR